MGSICSKVLDGSGFSSCFEDIYPFLLFIHLNGILVCWAFSLWFYALFHGR
ncbi:hypothetical protein DsansV1_C13g0122041 [Dioscorea sansibarensis]